MMRPTDNLRADHRAIATGLAILGAVGAHVRHGGVFPAADCAVVLRFVREFVVAVHLQKEASLVCPAVVMHGSDAAAGATGEVLRLHDEVVELGHSLVLFWEPSSELSESERLGFADTSDALILRLRRLEKLEEQLLFPVCDHDVPADDQMTWSIDFDRMEHGRTSRQEWASRLQPLAARWLG